MKNSGKFSKGRTRSSSSKSSEKRSFSKDSGGKRGEKRSYGSSSASEKPRFTRNSDGPGNRRSSRSDERGSDRPVRKSYDDEAPKRPYNRGEGTTGRPKTSRSFDEKPKRSFSSRDEGRSSRSEDSAKRPYNRGERSTDRPKTSRSFDEKPKRSYSNRDDSDSRGRDRREAGDERPKRAYDKGEYKSSERRDDRRTSFNDRAKTSRSFDEKPKRSFSRRDDSDAPRGERRSGGDDKRPRRSFDEAAPKRNYNRGESSESRRPTFGRDITPDTDRPTRRAFNDDAPKSEFDRSKRRTSSTGSRDSGRGGSRGDRPAGRGSAGGRGSFDKKSSFRGKSDDGGEFGAKKWNRKESSGFYGEKKKPSKARPKTDDDGSTRLNKFIANAGICSRREADEMIEAGVISVNGKVITEMGFRVQPGDEVKYNGETLRGESMVYILLNKPKDFITTTEDPEDRKTVMGLISKACKERVYPVGRLDRNTTGVLLFTNDGDLARKLTHPSFQMEKVYQVELDKNLKPADMQAIIDGLVLEDGPIKVDNILYAGSGQDKNVVGVELHSGKNRIVRRIFEHLGYEVKKLDRVIFAGLTKKDLPRGRWRFLTDMEVASLKMMTSKVKPK